MENSSDSNEQTPKRQYAFINLHEREQLVRLVLEKGMSLRKSARRMDIRLSTAKRILRRYRETGTFFESERARRQRLQAQAAEHGPPIPQSRIIGANQEQGVREVQNSQGTQERITYCPVGMVQAVSVPCMMPVPLNLWPGSFVPINYCDTLPGHAIYQWL